VIPFGRFFARNQEESGECGFPWKLLDDFVAKFAEQLGEHLFYEPKQALNNRCSESFVGNLIGRIRSWSVGIVHSRPQISSKELRPEVKLDSQNRAVGYVASFATHR
jgi:hypothetical protein